MGLITEDIAEPGLTVYTVLGRYADNGQTYAAVINAVTPEEAAKHVSTDCAEENGHDDPADSDLEILFVLEGNHMKQFRLEPYLNGRLACGHGGDEDCECWDLARQGGDK